jgi:hypothetical protein
MNPVTPADFAAALDALILRDAPPSLEDSDITVARLKERAKCSHKTAEALIAKWLEAGEVVSVGQRRNGSRTVEAWRLKAQTADLGSR